MYTKPILLLFILILTKLPAQTIDSRTLAYYNAEQVANELANFKKISKKNNNENIPIAKFPLKSKDTLFYSKGKIFRTLESSNGILNGKYQLFYDNGNLYSVSIFRNYLPVDSSIVYYYDGAIKSRIYYYDSENFKILNYYENGAKMQALIVKKALRPIDINEIYGAEAAAQSIIYYNKQGIEISKDEYKVLNNIKD